MLIPPLFDLTSRHRNEFPRSSSQQKHGQTHGFALLITITLLAFLVLLLVSLASLTRVETQVASNNQQLGQARQNALMALNIALGQLQRLTGPDRRVTAPANLGRGPGGATLTTQSGTSFWTGVWGDSAKTTANVPAPILLGWLVSGDEGAAVTQDLTAQDFGRITSQDATQAFTPDMTVQGLTTSNPPPFPSDLTINSSTQHAVLLAGPNSIGTNATTDLPGYVVAPLVPITAAAGTVPGLGPKATPDIGNYAWWVGDEGVKARVDLVDALAPHPASTDGVVTAFSPTSSQQQLRLQAAQRLGAEAITGLTAISNTLPNTTVGADARERLARMLSTGQLPLLDPGITAAAAASRFHDITTHSAGVLSDTARGGLLADLTQLFNATSDSAFRTRLQNYWNNDTSTTPARSLTAGAPLLDDLNRDGTFSVSWGGSDQSGPTWEQLWSFYHMGNLTTDTPAGVMTAGGVATPRGPTSVQHGIGPVLVEARIFSGIKITSIGGGQNQVDMLLHTAFALANPYTVPLAATDYTITVDGTGGFNLQFWVTGGSSSLWSNNNDVTNILNGIQFTLHSPQIAPGEARIFTLDPTKSPFTWSANGTFDMVNGWDPSPYQVQIVIPTGVTISDAQLATGINVGWGKGPTGGQGNTNLGLTLWGPGPVSFQRVDRLGMQGNDMTSANGVVKDTLRHWEGGFTVRRPGVSENPNDNVVDANNWRAPLLTRSATAPNIAGNASGYQSSFWRSSAQRYGGDMVLEPANASLEQLRVYWGKIALGTGPNADTAPGGELLNAVFFDVPAISGPLVSLGQLQHFNAGGNITAFGQVIGTRPANSTSPDMAGLAVSPAYAIGNSRASVYLARDAFDSVTSTAQSRSVYDASWLLNRTLWDRYFFSSVPQSGSFDFATQLLPNPRLRPFRDTIASNNLAAYNTKPTDAAANLLDIGAFNVNSTSVEAWKALFSSLNGVPYPGTATGLTGAFARSVRQTGGNTSAGDGISSDAWTGYRNLSAAEISNLATAMVAQVKLRGPFVSLADFVNRRLVANNATGIEGALAAAIATASLNSGVTASPYSSKPSGPSGAVDTAHLEPTQVAGVPGWIKQSDLLQALGPTLSARSDTFIIRTYGETLDPINSNAANPVVTARAWCEAVVQREPDYVDPTANTPEKRGTDLTTTNATFGRKYKIISFRWLTPADI